MESYLGVDAEGAAAASAAAFARPWRASIGAFRVDLGNVSSDSSSDEGAVLGTIPYVAYLCGYISKTCQESSGKQRAHIVPEVQNLAAAERACLCDDLMTVGGCRCQGRAGEDRWVVRGSLGAGLAGLPREYGPGWTACLSFDSA